MTELAPKTVAFPFAGVKTDALRNRGARLQREHDALLAAIEADLIVSRGRAITAVERSLARVYAATVMAIDRLHRRTLTGRPVDYKVYHGLVHSVITLGRRLGLKDRTVKADKADKAKRGPVSLADYLSKKGSPDASGSAASNTDRHLMVDDDEAGDA